MGLGQPTVESSSVYTRRGSAVFVMGRQGLRLSRSRPLCRRSDARPTALGLCGVHSAADAGSRSPDYQPRGS